MNSRWAWLLVSLGAFIVGLGLLLGFIHRYTVPHVLTSDFLPTTCVLAALHQDCRHVKGKTNLPRQKSVREDNIKRTGDKVGDTSKSSRRNRGSEDDYPVQTRLIPEQQAAQTRDTAPSDSAKMSKNSSETNTKVHASNHNTEKITSQKKSGDLMDQSHTQVTSRSTSSLSAIGSSPLCDVGSSDDVVVTCSWIALQYRDFRARNILATDVFADSWTYYQVSTDATNCPCPDCKISQAKHDVIDGPDEPMSLGHMTLGDHEYRIGDHVACWYNPHSVSEALLWKPSTMLVMNAMLWPTIVFILGFVGVFFSCLFVQQDDCRWRRDCCWNV